MIAAALDGSEFVVGPGRHHEGPAPLTERNLSRDLPSLRIDYGEHVGVNFRRTTVLSVGADHHIKGAVPDAYCRHLFEALGVIHVELVPCGNWDDREFTIRRQAHGVNGVVSQRDRLLVSESLWVRNVDVG